MLEICCFDIDSCLIAQEADADRIELCVNQGEGGVSPPFGLLKMCKELIKIPVYVMIRPRGGHFCYSKTEKKQMILDAQQVIDQGCQGIVTGALTENGNIDIEFMRQIRGLDAHIPITFHRAIDHSIDPQKVLLSCMELGVENILTSGSAVKATRGLDQIIRLKELAGNRINIMVGSGVNADNIAVFYKEGIRHFHLSASELIKISDNMYKNILFDELEYKYKSAVYEKVRQAKRRIESLVCG